MKRVIIYLLAFTSIANSHGQFVDNSMTNLSEEVAHLKDKIKELQENQAQSEKAKYLRNYQMILYGIEIVKEMQMGIADITGARNQNILYKKIIDINNPTSEALGFQLIDVIDRMLEDNINGLVLPEGEKRRLRGQVGGLVDGIKRTFPPLQIIGSAVSMISSFTTYKAKLEKLDRKTDSIVVKASYPITKEIIARMNNQISPYIDFYSQLNKTNSTYENALYGHVIEYRDFIEEVNALNTILRSTIDMDRSIGEQINTLFDLTNSSKLDFNYKQVNDSDTIRNLAGNCLNIYNIVERYKKFTSDFIAIQEDFYKDNLELLESNAKKLPIKNDVMIDKMIKDLVNIKKGNASENIAGFDESYRAKVKSIQTKLYALNRTRL